MPEVEDTVRPAEEPRAEARIGPAVDNRLEQLPPVSRVVLQIGVLDDDDVAGAHGERLANGGALAAIHGLQVQAIDAAFVEELLEKVAGAIGGTVVDDDDLFLNGRGGDFIENELDGVTLVIDGDQH